MQFHDDTKFEFGQEAPNAVDSNTDLKFYQTHLLPRFGVTSGKPTTQQRKQKWSSVTRFKQLQANALPENHANMLKSMSNMAYNLRKKNFNEHELFTRYTDKSIQLEHSIVKNLPSQHPVVNELMRILNPNLVFDSLVDEINPAVSTYVHGYVFTILTCVLF